MTEGVPATREPYNILPHWVLVTAPPQTRTRLLEYQLTVRDAAAVLGLAPEKVQRGLRPPGVKGWLLEHVKFNRRAFLRLHDVIEFGKRLGIEADLSALPAQLITEWNLGPQIQKTKEGT